MLKPLVATLLLLADTAFADAPRQITWDDLVPVEEPLDNPVEGVSQDIQEDLFFILSTESNIESGFIPSDGEAAATADEMRMRLRENGIDIDGLIAAVRAVEAELDRRDQLVVAELDRTLVRLPGYALPLEMTEEGVTEFLLVPYVGACIHTPPPPPNQMILVELDEPFQIRDLYDAVWITGEMSVEPSSLALSFVDGEAQVAAGYRLAGTLIEPYE